MHKIVLMMVAFITENMTFKGITVLVFVTDALVVECDAVELCQLFATDHY